MAYSEFYCQNGGSNLNAGSTNNNTAAYTSNAGNWTNITRVFTVTDGTNPSLSVSVGDAASVYVTAGATATGFIGRVTAVQNLVNGTVTFGAAFAGANPVNGTGTMTLKVGGAWQGFTGTVTFPFSLSALNNLANASGDAPRFNFKNDQTYSATVQVACILQGVIAQGYSSTLGDGGKATWTSNLTSAACFLFNAGTAPIVMDINFVCTGTSGNFDLVQVSTANPTFVRCVFQGARACGINITGQMCLVYECEAYDCNKNNTAAKGGFLAGGSGSGYFVNCISHDHTGGGNGNGFAAAISTDITFFLNCIADTCSGSGLLMAQSTGSSVFVSNCDFYNNTGDGIKNTNSGSPNGFLVIQNSNFIKNGGKGLNMAVTGSPINTITGYSYNNGYGSGTQANGSSDTLQSLTEIGKVTYASGALPWVNAASGDFRISLAAAINAGRGAFQQTASGYTGTIGYPDIGAANHFDVGSGVFTASDTVLPVGYIGHAYTYQQTYTSAATVTLLSGTLPTGLSLSQPTSSSYKIDGTPTTLGTYDFTVRVTTGSTFLDFLEHITISADPDQGIGGVGGG